MGVITELSKVKPQHVAIYVTAFLGILAPGFLLIFHYRPELIEKYDILKLIMLSASLSLPLFVINLVLTAALVDRLKLDEFNSTALAIIAFFSNSFVLYLALLISYIGSFRLNGYLIWAAVIEAVQVIGTLVLCAQSPEMVRGIIKGNAKDQSSEPEASKTPSVSGPAAN